MAWSGMRSAPLFERSAMCRRTIVSFTLGLSAPHKEGLTQAWKRRGPSMLALAAAASRNMKHPSRSCVYVCVLGS